MRSTTKQADFSKFLKVNHACRDAVNWIGDKTAQEAWDTAERADWMLWLLAKTGERKQVVRIACACARTVLKYVKDGELRPLRAIEAAEAWCDGTVDIETVRASSASYAAAAEVAAYAAAADSASYAAAAADSASYAAAAEAAAYAAASYASYAADAAADAADSAAYAAASYAADAADAADSAAAAADSASYAAYAAAAAADSAAYAAAAAADSASYASYASYAADSAADDAARREAHLEMCAIIRSMSKCPEVG